jgi:hypothetical protein
MVAFFNVSRFALSRVLECHGLKGFVYIIPNGEITYEGMVSAHTSWILINDLKREIAMNLCGLFRDWGV